MELNKSLSFKISNFTCAFRTLNESDVSQEYVSGLKDQKEYISHIPIDISISSQKKYVNDILYSKGDSICGLFINYELVGTAGVQSSTSFLQHIEDPNEYVATIGIFLFNKSYRGMGFGKTLVWASVYLSYNCLKTKWFGAGMANENIPSLKSFLSCGFKQIDEVDQNLRVLLKFSELKKPNFIKNLSIR